jgi:hypothetical protein
MYSNVKKVSVLKMFTVCKVYPIPYTLYHA